jgi:hypothetical protein
MTNYEGTPTTRTYPRSLKEAFPHDQENLEWFIRPPKHEFTMLEVFMIYIGLIIWVGLAYYFVRN